MKIIGVWLLSTAVAVGLAACSSTPNCLKKQPYENATAFPALKSPPGLNVPKPASDMTVPPVNGGPVAKYPAAPGGTDSSNPQSRCLTTPPPVPSKG